MKNSFNSYTLNSVSLAAAEAAVRDYEHFDKTRKEIIRIREKVSEELREAGFKVTESKANFIFASHPGITAEELYSRLKERGILVRHFKMPRIDNYLRITVGAEKDMRKLTDEINLILKF